MRTTVQVISYVDKVVCDGCLSKDGTHTDATDVLSLGARSYDLCALHAGRFAQYLDDALGQPGESEESAPVAVMPEAVAEPEHEAANAAEVEPRPSVMVAGEIPGYDWETAREAVRNLGYEVVGRADGSTVLLILGEGGERNGTKLRDAAERDIPCMDVRTPGRFKAAVCAGELVGGDPLPDPAKVDRSGLSERERNRLIRAWARDHGYSLPDKGRIPVNVRHAYEQSHRDASEGKAAAA